MVKAARLGAFQPNRYFFRILFLEKIVLTGLFVRQFGLTLPGAGNERTYLVIRGADANPDSARPH